ncbi:sigma-70 family RNA polymerase sigma factor [Verrucomicrobia bacterium]|nr:sigma-70 family RNA polymerase sigma factor [Verrucomicrobiota bacterium]
MERSDEELVKAVKSGDSTSFETLIIRYQPRIFAIARKHARLQIEVEDIVQEVFIKAFRKIDSFRGDAPFEHWLMRLTTRTCYDFLRKHQRNKENALADITDDEQRWLEAFQPDQEDNADQLNAARSLISRLLANLPPEDQMVIRLLDIENHSVREIADLTGWSKSLVKVRAFRARAKMRKNLEQLQPEKYL